MYFLGDSLSCANFSRPFGAKDKKKRDRRAKELGSSVITSAKWFGGAGAVSGGLRGLGVGTSVGNKLKSGAASAVKGAYIGGKNAAASAAVIGLGIYGLKRLNDLRKKKFKKK